MPELWRTVAENDRYEVSNLGNVRHKERMQILKPHFRCGYPCVQLGSPKLKRNIHQLVCIAWHGPRPDGMLACHRNDDRTDNRPENLYWGTHRQNMDDGKANQRFVNGIAHVNAKLTEADVVEMRRLRVEGMIYQKLAERFGVTKRAAILVCKRLTWRHIA